MNPKDIPRHFRLVRAFVNHWLPVLVPGTLLCGALALRITCPPALEEAQLRVFGVFQRLRPRAYQPVPVRIVDLDDETLSRMGQWPWPRTQVAKLVSRLAELGAAVVAFDIVFAEPDRTSPARILPLWPSMPEVEALRARLEALPDHDQVLAEAIGRASVVTGYFLSPQPGTTQPAVKAGFAHAGDNPMDYLPRWFRSAVTDLAPIESAAAGNGSFNMVAEADGLIRRVPLLFRVEGRPDPVPSLAAEALRVAQGAAMYVVTASGASRERLFGGHTGIASVKIGAFVVPTDAQGRVWLYDTGQVPERTVAIWRLFEPDFDPASIEGHIVFVGTSAPGLKDQRATLLNPLAPGVEVHAQIAEQVLAEDHLRRPHWADIVEVLYLAGLGLLLVLLLPRLGAAWCALVALLIVAAAFGSSWQAFTRARLMLDPVYPSLVALVVYMISSLITYLRTEAERRQVRHAFSRYMSPVLVERLAENPHLLKLGGEMREMTLLFADIRGFTTISEQFDAQGLTRFINRFLTPMTDIIMKHHGTIDKYMGDCIMAFWNAPLDDPKHARNGCVAALAMRDYLVQWNKQMTAEAEVAGKSHHALHVGIGLNTGNCCVGNMGSDQRFDYSVIGDDVNLASRLEGQSKVYGVDIVLGPSTAEQVADHATLELDLLQVKGKTKPVRIFALLRDAAFAAQPEFQALRAMHDQLLAAYRGRQWDEALRLIEACLALDTKFTRLRVLYALYRARIEAFMASPPAPDWAGVTVATSK